MVYGAFYEEFGLFQSLLEELKGLINLLEYKESDKA